MARDPGEIILYKNDGSNEEYYWYENVPSINDIGWSRDGYNFIEWNTESNGTGDSYFPGDVLGDSGNNPDLYAIWEEIPVLQKQPVLTYSINWGTRNIFQKLSGKTYVSPSGLTIDCSTLTVTFSSSQHFKKFYATAVKSGNDYGFINDVLVDIRETNPTGILLYELTERDANTNFSFTINTSSLTSGDGEYRIGLYVQNDDNVWNYEYFLLEANNLLLEESNNLLLLVPVTADFTYNPIPRNYYPLCADISNSTIFLFDSSSKTVVNSYGCNLKGIDSTGWNELDNNLFIYNNLCYMNVSVILKYYTINYTITNYNDSHLLVIANSGWPDVYQSSHIYTNVGPSISTVFPS